MSERTTIGGVAYETVGSSSSNLLLKCNGTARIQWGSKLIDLIKNGKLVSASEASDQIFIVSDESQIKSDGIYIINSDKTSQLWISKNNQHYNLSGTELYISASKQQDITVEQKQQAVENLGLYYDTLEDAQNAGIQNGLVYILSTKKLYTAFDGALEEFQAQLKTIAVEEEQENQDIKGEVINSSIKIVLSVADAEYLILSDNKIQSNYSVYIDNSAKICSEHQNYQMYVENGFGYVVADNISATNEVQTAIVNTTTTVSPNIMSDVTETPGFKLYTQEDASYLDIDYINARKWSPFSRGMIMMFDGKADIPEGWAICDGQTHTYEGVETTTPNLVGRFIKAVTDVTQVGVINQEHLTESNDFTLTREHLPEHSHPHQPHTHAISEIVGNIEESGNLSADLDSSNYACDISEQFIDVVSSVSYSDESLSTTTASVVSGIEKSTQGGTTTGSNHTHSLSITGGNIAEAQSVENVGTWENKTIKIEPNAYALIFIIKL